MKVIFVTREGYNLAGGRIRNYNFAKELSRRGVETEVLSYTDNLGARDGMDEGSMNFIQKINYNVKAYKKLSKERNSIIILQRVNYHSFAPLLTQIFKKNHLVLDIDDWEIRENPKYLLGIYPTSKAEYLTRKIASLSDLCIAASHYLKRYLEKFNKKTCLVPSCIDVELFKPCKNGNNNRNYHMVKFAWIGTLHRKQDVENVKFIIDCFDELRNNFKSIRLEIIGDGIYAKDLLSHLSKARYRESIDFIGWAHPNKIPLYLEKIDIGLLPLIQNTKFNLSKSPVKLFEYMAMEKPTISSCIGEAEFVVEDGIDGFLVNSKKDFIDKMKILSENENLRKKMGKNARKKVVSKYSLSSAIDILLPSLNKIYGNRLQESI